MPFRYFTSFFETNFSTSFEITHKFEIGQNDLAPAGYRSAFLTGNVKETTQFTKKLNVCGKLPGGYR